MEVGKITLVKKKILFQPLQKKLDNAGEKQVYSEISGSFFSYKAYRIHWIKINRQALTFQSVTYIKAYDDIRELFSKNYQIKRLSSS
jgi:excinuclease ABC subunit A